MKHLTFVMLAQGRSPLVTTMFRISFLDTKKLSDQFFRSRK